MHRSAVLAVRSRGIFSIFGKKDSPVEMTQMNPETKEKLKSALSDIRTDSPRQQLNDLKTADMEDIMDQQIDMDSIRARSLMQYQYNYNPPSQVENIVLNSAISLLGELSRGEITSYTFNDNSIKAKKLKHFPHNSRLSALKTVQDVIDFYIEPIQNVNEYTKLSRSNKLPKNVHVMEQPVRFHPEDTEACHGGITAFPGIGGQVLGLRNKRLYRQFQPKQEWFDYEDQTFDYNRPDKDMPWDPEIVKRMDRYPDKRYNIKTKTFMRTG